jgi:hypothetical protein
MNHHGPIWARNSRGGTKEFEGAIYRGWGRTNWTKIEIQRMARLY